MSEIAKNTIAERDRCFELAQQAMDYYAVREALKDAADYLGSMELKDEDQYLTQLSWKYFDKVIDYEAAAQECFVISSDMPCREDLSYQIAFSAKADGFKEKAEIMFREAGFLVGRGDFSIHSELLYENLSREYSSLAAKAEILFDKCLERYEQNISRPIVGLLEYSYWNIFDAIDVLWEGGQNYCFPFIPSDQASCH